MKKISIFSYSDPISFLKDYLKSLPSKGHGQLRQWAQQLGIHTTLMSQIMSGSRHFSTELALEMCDILKLPQLESDYFLNLVESQKAATIKLKKYYQNKMNAIKNSSENLVNRVKTDKHLTEKEQAQFYSSWKYQAIRLCCSLGEGVTISEIHNKFFIPEDEILKILEFLREAHLVTSDGNRFKIGSRFTHLDKNSIYLSRHHLNWRLKAINRAPTLSDQELMYTAPFSIGKKDFKEFRERCVLLIQEFMEIAKKSEAEELACFNLDLFFM